MSVSIPLPVLLGLVVSGLAGTAAALHLMGWSKTVTLDRPEAAVARFSLDHPEVAVLETVVTEDASAALLALADGTLGLVVAFGDRFVVRVLGPGALVSVHSDARQITLRLADIAFPRAHLRLSASPDRDRWFARLGACVASSAA